MTEPSHTTPTPESSYTLLWILGLIFLMAFLLRVWNLDWGLPFRLHPDEWKYVSGGANACMGEWNPKYFRNPPGFSYLNALWFPLWVKIHPPVAVPEWLGIDPQWTLVRSGVKAAYFYRPFDLVLGVRLLSALFGSLTVVAIFGIGREFFSKWIALIAAGMTAVSFAAVRESHFAVNDSAAVFLLTVSLWLGLCAFRKDSRCWLYSAACLSGVAIAFKYNTFPALAAVIGFHCLGYWKNRTNDRIIYFLRDSGVVILIAVISFLLICPFPLLDPGTFFAEMAKLREASRHPWQGQDPRWPGIQLLETIWISEGALASVLALGGFWIALWRRQWHFLLFPVFYVLLLITHPLFFVRFTLPLLPWISLAVAGMASLFMERFWTKPWSRILGGVMLVAAFIQPVANDIRHAVLLGRMDTRIEFMQWIKTENREPRRVATDQFALPLVYRGIADVWTEPLDSRIVYIDPLDATHLGRFFQTPSSAGLIAVSDFVTLPGLLPYTYEQRRDTLRRYAGHLKPLRVFQPFQSEWQSRSGDSEDVYSPFRTLWKRDRPGPVIELFARE